MSPSIHSFVLGPATGAGTNPWLIVVVALVAAVMGMGVVKLLGYLRKRDAEKEAQPDP